MSTPTRDNPTECVYVDELISALQKLREDAGFHHTLLDGPVYVYVNRNGTVSIDTYEQYVGGDD